MVISAWDGWKWMCFNCDHVGRSATDSEIEEQEGSIHQIKGD